MYEGTSKSLSTTQFKDNEKVSGGKINKKNKDNVIFNELS